MTQDERRLLEEKYLGDASAPGFAADRERLASGEPLAYVIGWQPFLGLKIFLDSHPLIPRPETEWWTEHLLKESAKAEQTDQVVSGASASDGERHEQIFSRKLCVPRNGMNGLCFLDLCAGSGAIGCAALKALPYMEVFFGEIDQAHEATIHKNIHENNLDARRAHIRIGDLFEPFAEMTFDIIAANPPYIPSSRTLDSSVADYEPPRALYAGTDGLAIIRRIASELPRHLSKNGTAWIECDSSHAEAARELFESNDLVAEIRPDQYGAPRVIVVSWP